MFVKCGLQHLCGDSDMTGIYPEGTIIDGRYRIERRLGRGGFATVYQAEHLQLGRRAALKVLEPVAPHITERFQARFNTEARIAANLDHPNVVRIFDFGFIEGDDRPYIAMEMLEGRDLEAFLEDEGAMDPVRARRLFLPVLDALRLGHERGIVHKDLKPSNLYLVKEGTDEERVVVLDYGIARIEGDANPRYTEEGTYTGTPAYRPPEYIHRREVTPAYDVYQVGLIFIELMTGQPVVVAGSQIAYMVAHVEGQHRIPDGFTDTPLGAALVKAIAVEPSQRYGDAGEMLAAIEIADVGVGTDFTLPAITLDDAQQQQITSRGTLGQRTTEPRIPPRSAPRKRSSLAPLIGLFIVFGVFGCGGLALLTTAWFVLEEAEESTWHPGEAPLSAADPGLPFVDSPQVPTMPNIGQLSDAGQEMHAWLLSRYMILTTLNQVRLYEDILQKTGGWSANGASFVPTGTDDLLGLAAQQMQIGLDTPPRRAGLEQQAQAMSDDLAALGDLLGDLYDYHSVQRGWEVDQGAHGKELTQQLLALAKRFRPQFQQFSTQVDKELIHHLAAMEDEHVGDRFVQAATRAMLAQAKLITVMTDQPNSPKSNDALSKFDTELQALEQSVRAERAALTERYSLTGGIHNRYLSSLKDTRKQAAELRAAAKKGDDVRSDTAFLWMQLHMTFGAYNQLQRF